jgi:hypothetical protein
MKTFSKLRKVIPVLLLMAVISTPVLAYTMSQRVAYCATLDYIMQHNTLSDGALLGARIGAAEAGCAEVNTGRIAAYQEANF